MPDDEAKVRSVAQERIDRRRAILASGGTLAGTVTNEQKRMIIELLEHGGTLAEIETLEGMPSAVTIWRACKSDPVFGELVTEAREFGAGSLLDEAQHQLRRALETNDPDTMRVASDYSRSTTAYVEKTAPKRYGAMLKHAGADGGALVVQTISYAVHEARSLNADSEKVAREAELRIEDAIAEG